jgi:hypothetical protein
MGFHVTFRLIVRLVGLGLALAVGGSAAFGYINYPPMTLQTMCKDSTNIRLLSIKKFDREKGTIEFEIVETLKGAKQEVKSCRHALRTDATGVKPILDWAKAGKQAVQFSCEFGAAVKGLGYGYVFIDNYCYSINHSRTSESWLLILAEPNMSACYDGSAEQLRKLAKEILAGKEVKVPVKQPAKPPTQEEIDRRGAEVEGIMKNRK